MKPGDIFYTKRIEASITGPEVRGTMGFKAPKDGALVAMFLGAERNGEPVDVIATLYELGWSSPAFPDPREQP